jgi:DNA-binding MarR family transcriptional regulator
MARRPNNDFRNRKPVGTPDAVNAVAHTRKAIEQLIEKGLVRGRRLTNAEGVYFADLKLTAKGQQAAIRVRNEQEAAKKAMDEGADQAHQITKMLNDAAAKMDDKG